MSPRDPDRCSAPYRVRFDEAGPDGLLRTSVLLRFAQDLAWHHSASRGFGRARYAERGLAWLVRAAEVAVLAPVEVGSEIVGITQVIGARRVWARRRTDFYDAAGRLVAGTEIDWILLDGRGAPTRIPTEFDVVFGAPSLSLSLARVLLDPPPADARRVSFTVRPQELDPMNHVNNAVYADWLDEAVIAGGDPPATRAIPRVARLEYAAPADAGSRVSAAVWPGPEGWSFSVGDDAGRDLLRARLEPGRAQWAAATRPVRASSPSITG